MKKSKSNKPVVGFDMDGVIAHNQDIVAARMSEILGIDVNWRMWSDYAYFLKYGMTYDDFLQVFIDSRALQLATPDKGTADSIQQLRKDGYEVAIITARGFHPEGEEITKTWLGEQAIPVDHVVVVHPTQTKVEAISSFPGMVAYIDDHADHLDKSREAMLSPKLYMYDQPWNQHSKDHVRVRSVEEYVDIVQKESKSFSEFNK